MIATLPNGEILNKWRKSTEAKKTYAAIGNVLDAERPV